MPHRKIFLLLFLLLLILASFLVFNPQSVYADDDFIYGVQIFNRPIDWGNNDSAGFRVLLEYADELGVNLIRGGTTADNVSEHIEYSGVLWGMNTLLPMLAEHNMILDWVLTGTAERDYDYSAIERGGPNYAIPPLIANWQNLIALCAQNVRSHNTNVIYEIWNEPDLATGNISWRGSLSKYWNELFTTAINTIHTNDNANAQIINGGLVLGGGEADYMTRAIQELKAGTISMLAIHAHDPFYTFMNLVEKENFSGRGVSMSDVFLNECGYDGVSGSSEGGKTFNIASKVLGAKALGMKGIVVYHMGLKSKQIVEGNDAIIRKSQLLDVAENGTCTPTETFYAVKTAIRFTKGLKPVDSHNDVGVSDEGYIWLFRSDDGKKKTLACIGKLPSNRTEIEDALGSEEYEAYDIYGNIFSGNTIGKYDIVYYVSEHEPEPASMKINITTSQSDIDRKECKVNEEYSFELKSEPSLVNWTMEDGELPPGLELQTSGTITGTPTKEGTYEFTLLAEADGYESSSCDLSITVAPEDPVTQTISITTRALNVATEGQPYSVTLKSNPSGAEWTSNINIPGLTLTSSGTLHGIPSSNGTYRIRFTASKEGWQSSSVTLTLTINPKPAPKPPVIDIEHIVSGKFGELYTMKLSANTEGVTWVLDEDSELPEGLLLNEYTGVISGIPKEYGRFEFTVYAEKDGLISEAETFTIEIASRGEIEILTSQEDFDGEARMVGSKFELKLKSIPESVSWDIEGEFPSEFALLSDEGIISGVPSRTGIYEFTLIAELEGYESDERDFVLKVLPAEDEPDNDNSDNNNPNSDNPDNNNPDNNNPDNNNPDNNNPDNNNSNENNPTRTKGSRGGCNSGFGALMLIVLMKRR